MVSGKQALYNGVFIPVSPDQGVQLCLDHRRLDLPPVILPGDGLDLLDQEQVRYGWGGGGCSDWVKRDSKAINDAKKDNDFS